jgi:predicted nucleic acid-binding Zn ribbon protein
MIGAGGAVIFKGSGFYQTDYRSEEYKSKAKKETEPVKSEKSETKTTEKK